MVELLPSCVVDIVYDTTALSIQDLDVIEEHIRSLIDYYSPLSSSKVRRIIVSRRHIKESSDADANITDKICNLIFVAPDVDPRQLFYECSQPVIGENLAFVVGDTVNLGNKNALINVVDKTGSHILFADEIKSREFFSDLDDFILKILQDNEIEIYGNAKDPIIDAKSLTKIADEIDFAIEAILDMRLNNTFDVVSKLRAASDDIRKKSKTREFATKSDVREFFDNLTKLCEKLIDALENKKFAGLAVCGIIGSVLSLLGTPAITATALCMAYAQGPAAFEKFMLGIGKYFDAGIDAKPPIARARTRRKSTRRSKVRKDES